MIRELDGDQDVGDLGDGRLNRRPVHVLVADVMVLCVGGHVRLGQSTPKIRFRGVGVCDLEARLDRNVAVIGVRDLQNDFIARGPVLQMEEVRVAAIDVGLAADRIGVDAA